MSCGVLPSIQPSPPAWPQIPRLSSFQPRTFQRVLSVPDRPFALLVSHLRPHRALCFVLSYSVIDRLADISPSLLCPHHVPSPPPAPARTWFPSYGYTDPTHLGISHPPIHAIAATYTDLAHVYTFKNLLPLTPGIQIDRRRTLSVPLSPSFAAPITTHFLHLAFRKIVNCRLNTLHTLGGSCSSLQHSGHRNCERSYDR